MLHAVNSRHPMASLPCDKSELLLLTRVAEASGRYRDVLDFLWAAGQVDGIFSIEDRVLLVTAFQHEVHRLLRSIHDIEKSADAVRSSQPPVKIGSAMITAEESVTVQKVLADYIMNCNCLDPNDVKATATCGDCQQDPSSKGSSTVVSPDSPAVGNYKKAMEGVREDSSEISDRSVPKPKEASSSVENKLMLPKAPIGFIRKQLVPAKDIIGLAGDLKWTVQEDLIDLCHTTVALITDILLPSSQKTLSYFLRKFRIDIYRLLLENHLLSRYAKAIAGGSANTFASTKYKTTHHHLFLYPNVNSADDIAEMYRQLLMETSLALSTHNPIRAAIVLNACDFLGTGMVTKAAKEEAYNVLEVFLSEVTLENVTAQTALQDATAGPKRLNDSGPQVCSWASKDERDQFYFILTLLRRSQRFLEADLGLSLSS